MPVAVRGFAVETGLFQCTAFGRVRAIRAIHSATYVPAETPRHCSRLTQETMLERTPRLRGGCTLHGESSNQAMTFWSSTLANPFTPR